jgi:two-component system, OmpR family, sensor histidine kinase SenX3
MSVFTTAQRQHRALVKRVYAVAERIDVVSARLGVGGDPATLVGESDPAKALVAAWGRLEPRLDALASGQILQRVAVETVTTGVVGVDAAGREVFRNVAADRVLGGGPGHVVAEESVRAVLTEVVASGKELEHEVEVFGPPRRVLLVRAVPVVEHGKRGAVATIVDVSEQRRINAIRRDFVANISHELRTPIGALAVLSETIASEDDPETIRRLAGRLEGEAHRLNAMVNDLLALSRIEGDETHSVVIPVAQLVREAVDRARSGSEQRGVQIRVDDIPSALVVEGDRVQLVSALHNLLENALKYSDKDQPVVIGASAEVSGRAMAAIWVRDEGIGIPTRDQERIFERFYRVDHARARDTGGTGLGLAIVRHVAVNHDGDIHVQSIEGDGSTFTLRIPRLVPDRTDTRPGGGHTDG